MMNVGLLHPGEMGVTVGNSLCQSGHRVFWLPTGRSAATQARASQVGLVAAASADELFDSCQLIIAVCPPQFAEDLVSLACSNGFSGTYVEANALSPHMASYLADRCSQSGIALVDGSLIGPPAWTAGTTTLYLCGQAAQWVSECFAGGPLAATVLNGSIGDASALKMCDSAFNKSLLAVLYQTLATAEKLGVRKQLQAVWDANPGGAGHVSTENNRICLSARKAWRFVPEMEMVIATVQQAGLNKHIFRHTLDIYRALTCFDGDAEPPTEEAVMASLLGADGRLSKKRG